MSIGHNNNTKIVATIGPASRSYDNLLELAKAGVDVYRMNFSHGTHEDHLSVIENITKINEAHGTHLSLLADLQGPKLRVGKIENNHLDLEEGQILTFTNEKCIGTAEKIYMSYERFAMDVNPGEKVLVDDGKVELEVVETNGKDEVKLKVLFGTKLSSNKGVNLPQTAISLPSLTEKDQVDLAFILTQPKVNWIALSFVRHEDDLHDLRKRVQAANHPARLISKVEKPEAIERMDEIIEASDAIMVARGDLGVEMPIQQLPLLQKTLISKCIKKARPVIVATQMMDSMITNPSPTRAEVTDVANAVLDGTDAVMLSGETSVGRHPARVVREMRKIITEAEKRSDIYNKGLVPDRASKTYVSDAICYNACKVAKEVDAKVLVGITTTGYTGIMTSSCRPITPIYMYSWDDHVLKTLQLAWGVRGKKYDSYASIEHTIDDIIDRLKGEGLLEAGDVVVNTGGLPLRTGATTNMMKISVVK